jgi:NADH-quinone oxidoreductase subunit F
LDLKPIEAEPTAEEREAIDCVCPHSPPSGLSEARERRHLLLPALHAAQARVGWISPGALGHACNRLGIPPAEGFGVASFYALFALRPRPARVVHLCNDIACKMAGADDVERGLTRRVGPPGQAKDGATWLESPCLGLCDQAPAAMLTQAGAQPFESAWGGATLDDVTAALAGKAPPARQGAPVPQRGSAGLRLLARVGVVDPTSLDDYRAHGGYVALRRALELGPAAVVREVSDAKLLGRGGAAFPTGRKWEAVARATVRPHYLVCNADESEPGTFKDRVLMEEDPFALIEAMTIAGFAVGADKAFIYLRGEYPLALARLENAIAAARARGLLGDDVLGRGIRFDVEIRRGAGAYICGEETALFNSLEGFRGEPRNKPPFPAEVGLFGKPTCVNNVETLVSVLSIVNEGAAAYRALGTADSAGTRLFCVSGRAARPGIYEIAFGTTLRELLTIAGAPLPGGRIRTVLLGGAAGVFVAPDELDLPLSFEGAREAKATLGSGVVMVFDDAVPLEPILARIAAFFRDESCGQCVPCRVGTVRQEELLTRLVRKRPLGSVQSERALLADLGQAMRDASICGLGHTASSAIESAIAKLGLFSSEEPR